MKTCSDRMFISVILFEYISATCNNNDNGMRSKRSKGSADGHLPTSDILKNSDRVKFYIPDTQTSTNMLATSSNNITGGYDYPNNNIVTNPEKQDGYRLDSDKYKGLSNENKEKACIVNYKAIDNGRKSTRIKNETLVGSPMRYYRDNAHGLKDCHHNHQKAMLFRVNNTLQEHYKTENMKTNKRKNIKITTETESDKSIVPDTKNNFPWVKALGKTLKHSRFYKQWKGYRSNLRTYACLADDAAFLSSSIKVIKSNMRVIRQQSGLADYVMKRLDDLIDMYQNFANSIRLDLKTKSKRAECLIKHDRIHRLCDEFPGYLAYIMWLMLKEKRKDIKIIEAIAIHMRKKLLSL